MARKKKEEKEDMTNTMVQQEEKAALTGYPTQQQEFIQQPIQQPMNMQQPLQNMQQPQQQYMMPQQVPMQAAPVQPLSMQPVLPQAMPFLAGAKQYFAIASSGYTNSLYTFDSNIGSWRAMNNNEMMQLLASSGVPSNILQYIMALGKM